MTPSSMLIVTVILLTAKPSFSFSLPYPNPNFQAEAGLSYFGDAHFAGYYVQLNHPTPSSSGLLIRSKPFKCSSSTSFSTNFNFEIGNSIALVIVPAVFPSQFNSKSSFSISGENSSLVIEFEGNVCKIVPARVSNVSKISAVLKTGVKLSCSIDYRASLKRLDVRLSKLGDPRPVSPLISYRVDLGEMWKGEKVLLGLVSSSGNSEQTTRVYSWTSVVQDVPKWLHSHPVNPENYPNMSSKVKTVKKKRGCFLSGFIIAMVCGALTALALLFVWSYVADTQRSRPEATVCPVDFKYEKIGVVVESNSEADKK